MAGFVLRRFTNHSLKDLVINNWHNVLGVSELALSKLLIHAHRRLLFYLENDIEHFIVANKKQTPTFKVIKIILYAIFVHLQYTAVILFLNIKCYIKNKSGTQSLKKILATSKQIFFGDFARSFKGFCEITKATDDSSLICILAPSDYKKELATAPNDIYYSTGNIINIYTFFKSISFLVTKGYSYARQNGNLTNIASKYFGLFLLDFTRNIYFIEYSKKISIKTNNNALIILRDDAYYAPLIDAYNKTKNPTIHIIHGTSNNDELSTVPSLAKNIFCGGSREVQIFTQWLKPSNIFDIAAPLQVIEKDNIIINPFIKNTYDIVFLVSISLNWIHRMHCNVLSEANSVLKNKKILVRHRPSSISVHKDMIESALTNYVVSKNKSLIDDVACAEIILCASEDCLLTCLMNHKKVIYFPDLEPDIHYYASSFANRLENLVVVGTAEELITAINNFENLDFKVSDEKKYKEELRHIFGEIKMEKIVANFTNAFEQIHLNRKSV
jgi:hypothetical protein